MFAEMNVVASGNGYSVFRHRINQSLQCDHLHTKRKRKGSSLRLVFVFFFIRAQISRNEMSKCGDAISSVSPFWYRITQAIQKTYKPYSFFFFLAPKTGFALNHAGNFRTDVVVLIDWVVCEFHTIVVIRSVFVVNFVCCRRCLAFRSVVTTLRNTKTNIKYLYYCYFWWKCHSNRIQINAQIEFEGGNKWLEYRISDWFWVGIRKKTAANSPLNIWNKL